MQKPCSPRLIIIFMVFSSFPTPFKPWTFWFRTRHSWGQVSRGLVCTRECNSLRWPVTGVLPLWSYHFDLGGSSLNCNGLLMNHGTGWEWRFHLEESWRGVRWQSLKGAAGSDCAGLSIWQVIIFRSCPHRSQFYANAVALETREINGIFLRCLLNKMYRTILSLRRGFVVKTWWQPYFPTRWRGTGGRSRL